MEYGFLAAGYFVRYLSSWDNLNEYADAGDFRSYTKGVNGGLTNYDRRAYYLDLAWEALPEDLSIGAGGDLMFEKYNLVAAADAPWDRAIA